MAAHGELRNVAVDHFPMRGVRRLFESGVDKSNDVATEFRDERDGFSLCFRRMLTPFPVATCDCLTFRDEIACRIQTGMIPRTLQKHASDSIGIFCRNRTDYTLRQVRV